MLQNINDVIELRKQNMHNLAVHTDRYFKMEPLYISMRTTHRINCLGSIYSNYYLEMFIIHTCRHPSADSSKKKKKKKKNEIFDVYLF